jgi:uncharacterized membrane protein
MAQNLAEHHAAVTVNAPVHQVYGLFSHFNDFPKFMSFVKEVTYYDEQRSHWVAEVSGRHEWDAVNQDWVSDQQIGWRSTDGLENYGKVTFQPVSQNQTRVDVYVNYNPPAGILGDIGEKMGAGSRFDNALQHDLDNFARMVDQAPPGALNPESSNYLFHSGSAAATGTTTDRQNATMEDTTGGARDRTTTPGSAFAQTPADQPPASTMQGGTMTPESVPTQGNYPVGPGTAYTPPSREDMLVERPTLDRDIIQEPTNTPDQAGAMQKPGTAANRNVVMPPEERTDEDVLPPEQMGGSGKVMPPERGTNPGY